MHLHLALGVQAASIDGPVAAHHGVGQHELAQCVHRAAERGAWVALHLAHRTAVLEAQGHQVERGGAAGTQDLMLLHPVEHGAHRARAPRRALVRRPLIMRVKADVVAELRASVIGRALGVLEDRCALGLGARWACAFAPHDLHRANYFRQRGRKSEAASRQCKRHSCALSRRGGQLERGSKRTPTPALMTS